MDRLGPRLGNPDECLGLPEMLHPPNVSCGKARVPRSAASAVKGERRDSWTLIHGDWPSNAQSPRSPCFRPILCEAATAVTDTDGPMSRSTRVVQLIRLHGAPGPAAPRPRSARRRRIPDSVGALCHRTMRMEHIKLLVGPGCEQWAVSGRPRKQCRLEPAGHRPSRILPRSIHAAEPAVPRSGRGAQRPSR